MTLAVQLTRVTRVETLALKCLYIVAVMQKLHPAAGRISLQQSVDLLVLSKRTLFVTIIKRS
jgi:hypothetical protein